MRNMGKSKRLDWPEITVLMNMEVMEEEWIEEMNNVMRAFLAESQLEVYHRVSIEFDAYNQERAYEYEHLVVYFVYRYLRKSVTDHKFLERAKFTLEDRIETARIFCKEVEYSNMSLEHIDISKILCKDNKIVSYIRNT